MITNGDNILTMTNFKNGINGESICKTIAYKTTWLKPLQKLTKQTWFLMEIVALILQPPKHLHTNSKLMKIWIVCVGN